jgi:predicted outer membrane repeat protein
MKGTAVHLPYSSRHGVVVLAILFLFVLANKTAQCSTKAVAPQLVSTETTRLAAEALCRSRFGAMQIFARETYLDTDGERSCDVYVFARGASWEGRERELQAEIRNHRELLFAYTDSIRNIDQYIPDRLACSEALNRFRKMTDYHIQMSTRPDEFVSVYTSTSRNHKPVMEYREGLPESFVMLYDLEREIGGTLGEEATTVDFYYFGPDRLFAVERGDISRVFRNLNDLDFTVSEDQVAGFRFNMTALDEEAAADAEVAWSRIMAMTPEEMSAIEKAGNKDSRIIANVPYFRQADWGNILPYGNSCAVMAGGSVIGYHDDFGLWNICPFSWHEGGDSSGGFISYPGVNYQENVPGAPNNPRDVHYGPETLLYEIAESIGYDFEHGYTSAYCEENGWTFADLYARYTNDHLGLDFAYDQDCAHHGAWYGTIKDRVDADQPMILAVTHWDTLSTSGPFGYVGGHVVTIVGYDEEHWVGGKPVGIYVNNTSTYGVIWWDYDQIASDNREITVEVERGGSPGSWVDAPTLLTPLQSTSPGNVHFSWQAVMNAAAYRLQISQYPDFRSYIHSVIRTGPSGDLDLNIEGTYYWRVASANENGVFCRFGQTESFTVGGCCATWHVTSNGSDETGDGSVENPFASIQAGIDASGHFETVLVAPGTYFENISINKQIAVTSHLFDSSNEGYISETIIDGGRAGAVVSIVGSTATVASLRGFTIRNGLSDTGGGIAVARANPTLSDLVIVDNEATSKGGGIWLYQSNSLIENVTVSRNKAVNYMCSSSGGGINCVQGNPTLRNVVISWNEADLAGGGLRIVDGAHPILENITIAHNSVTSTTCFSAGGGVELTGAAVTMTEVTIRDNLAETLQNSGVGAGISATDSEVTIQGGVVSGNQSSSAGAGVGLRNSILKLDRVRLHGNSSTGTIIGGTLFCNAGSTAIMTGVTFSDNSSVVGGGIHIQDDSDLIIANSILWSESPRVVYCSDYAAPSTLTITSSDVEGGQAGVELSDNATLNWLEGNLNLDPLFGDPEHAMFDLIAQSPCIDVGTTNFEWGGVVIVELASEEYAGDAPDLGALETVAITAVVNPSGDGDFASIGDAVSSVPTGTVLVLEDGVYSGPGNRDIDFAGKVITIRSASKNPERCVIDCQGEPGNPHRGFHFQSGEGANTRVEDITIINGYAAAGMPGGEYGGGVLCENGSSPTLINVTFSANKADGEGGAIYCSGSSPILEACTLTSNLADVGAGLACDETSAPTLLRTIVAFNGPGEAIACADGATPLISCTDIFGNTGGDWIDSINSLLGVEGNISEDPSFCSLYPDDDLTWMLQDDSPCLIGNSLGGCHMGAWPIGCGSVSNFLSNFTLSPESGCVVIQWEAAGVAGDLDFRLRGRVDDQSWEVSFEGDVNGRYRAVDDRGLLVDGGTFFYELETTDFGGSWVILARESIEVPPVAAVFRLDAPYPNPFNPQTVISFSINKPQQVRLTIYDLTGRLIAVLWDDPLVSGSHQLVWDGYNRGGQPVSSGIYLVRLQGDLIAFSRKLVVVR